MLTGKCLIHAADCTEFTTHTAGITVIIFRQTVITDRFGGFRIERTCKLSIPVEDTACICHLIIDVSGMWDPFCDIGSVCSDF